MANCSTVSRSHIPSSACEAPGRTVRIDKAKKICHILWVISLLLAVANSKIINGREMNKD
jgi:hypothetical protein